MAWKKGSDSIKLFLFKKIIREFKPVYFRALCNYALFGITHRLERLTPVRFLRHRFLKPVALQVQVNKICNLSCAFCFVNDLNEKVARTFTVTPETFQRMLDHPLLNSLTRMGFTGGEPLLHPNLFDFIEQAKRTIPTVSINTNFALAGTMSQGHRRIDRLNRSRLDMITISFYEENVKQIEEFAPQLSDRMFKRLSFLVSAGSDRFHSFERMHDVAAMAVRLGFHGLCYQNFDSMAGVSAQQANLNKFDVSGFLPITHDERYLAVEDHVARDFSDQIGICFPVPKKRLKKKVRSYSCYQPDFQIGADAKGSLSPCCNLDRLPEFGNLFSDDNWNNKTFQKIRAGIKLKDVDPMPYCAACTYLDVNLHDT